MEVSKSMETKIGEKIRNFRKRAGKSQFELELEIEASPGSMSRIESGLVNPTKETLRKIIEALALTDLEKSYVFGIESTIHTKIIANICDLIKEGNDSSLLNKSVNMFLSELNLYGIIVCLLQGEFIQARALTRNLYTPIIEKIIGTPFNNLKFRFDAKEFKTNYMYRAITEKSVLTSNELIDFACPPLTLEQAKAAAVFIGEKSSICFPIFAEGKSIGAILFTKNIVDSFDIEMNVLQEFTNIIGYKLYQITTQVK